MTDARLAAFVAEHGQKPLPEIRDAIRAAVEADGGTWLAATAATGWAFQVLLFDVWAVGVDELDAARNWVVRAHDAVTGFAAPPLPGATRDDVRRLLSPIAGMAQRSGRAPVELMADLLDVLIEDLAEIEPEAAVVFAQASVPTPHRRTDATARAALDAIRRHAVGKLQAAARERARRAS